MRPRVARRRDRRRLHRLGDRGGARRQRCRVTMVFPEPGIGFRALPRGALDVRRRLLPREGRRGTRGRDGRPSVRDRVEPKSGVCSRRTPSSRGSGSIPDTELAEAAGLEVDDGIVVDEYGRVQGTRTCSPPVTSPAFPCARSARRCASSTRTTRTRTAAPSARTWPAPRRRTTTCRSSTPTSSTSATRQSAIVDSRLDAVEKWQEPNRKGVITYVEDGKPRGVLLWNVWDKLDDARELIRAGEGALAV